MKIETITKEAAAEILASTPERKAGVWAKVIGDFQKGGVPVKVSGLSRGQCWGLKRMAKAANVEARVIEKSSAVLLVPPVKEPKKE